MSAQRPKVLMHIECLRGTGELTLASRIAQALADKGMDVVVASGNPRHFFPANNPHISIKRLPKISYSESDGCYKTDDVQNLNEAPVWKKIRSDELNALYDSEKPDVVMLSYWPFGNGHGVLDEEMNGLVDHIKASGRNTKIVGSIRDVVYADSLPRGGSKEAAAAMINDSFDKVFVHGAEDFIPLLEKEFDYTKAIAPEKIGYTGYVCERKASDATQPKNTILVTAGGGDYRSSSANTLIKAVLALPYLDAEFLKGKKVSVLGGRNFPPDQEAKLHAALADTRDKLAAKGAAIELIPTLPLEQYQERLGDCALFIGQAGVGTVMDVMSHRYPAVVVPVEEIKDGYDFREQRVRADLLMEKRLLKVMPESAIESDGSEIMLAQRAMEAVGMQSARHLHIPCDGAANTANAVAEMVGMQEKQPARTQIISRR